MDSTSKDHIPPELLLDCFWRLSLDLHLEYASPAATTMFGIPAGALAGSPLTDHVDPDDVDDLRDLLTRRLAGTDRARSFLAVVRVRHADGHLVPVEVHGRLVLGLDREPEAVVGLARDITRRQERLDRERELERRRLQEQRLDSLVRLARAVAAPLAGLVDVVDAAGSTADDPALGAAGERARRTLEQLRRLAGEEALPRQALVLDRFVTDVLDTFDTAPPASAAGTGTDATTGAPRPRVLLVDDDHDVLRYCSRVLHSAGFDVIACEDGAEALGHVADEESLDLVVLDWALPGLDGRRVREQLMARHPRLPVLIISGYQRGDFELLGGVDATTPWLHKPFTPAALLTAVRRLLPFRGEARES